jgi:hypothetical protein
MPEPNKTIQPKKRAFLRAYAETGGNISKAAEAAGITRWTHYEWLRIDPDYPDLFEDARTQAGDTLEAEATRRAVEGVLEPVFYQGQEVGAVRRYSDTLLIVRLKAAKPEEYRERSDMKVSPAQMTDDALVDKAAAIIRKRPGDSGGVSSPEPEPAGNGSGEAEPPAP